LVLCYIKNQLQIISITDSIYYR